MTPAPPAAYVPEPGGDVLRADAYRALFAATALLFLTLFPHQGALGLASAPLFLLCLLRFVQLAGCLAAPAPAVVASDASSGLAADPGRRGLRALGCLLAGLQLLRSPGAALLPSTWPYAHRLWALLLLGLVLWATRCVPSSPQPSQPQPKQATTRSLWLAGLALAATALCFGYLLRQAPSPRIDVFGLQQRAAELLLSGRNPYRALYPNPYDPVETTEFFGHWLAALDHYPYPPLSLLLSTACFRLTGDVRWLFLLCQLVIGGGLYRLAAPRRGEARSWDRGLGLLSLHLLHPCGFLVVEQAWTEPLLAALLGLWLLFRQSPAGRGGSAGGGMRRLWLDGLLLGLAVAGKQYGLLLLLPFLLPRLGLHLLPTELRPYRGRWLAICGLPTLLTYLPFVLVGPADFVEDVVLFQLRQPFRREALSLPALFHALSDLQLPGATAAVGLVLPLWYLSRRRPSPSGLASGLPAGSGGFLLVVSLQLFGFFATAKQAFCNYYYFLGVLLLAALSLLRAGPGRRR